IPVPLPESLRAGLDSPHPGIRIGAVTDLGEWLTGNDPGRAATARQRLQEVADTDIPRVADSARTLLNTATKTEPPTSVGPHAAAPAPGSPSAPVPPSHLSRTLTGHTSTVWVAAFSPD